MKRSKIGVYVVKKGEDSGDFVSNLYSYFKW